MSGVLMNEKRKKCNNKKSGEKVGDFYLCYFEQIEGDADDEESTHRRKLADHERGEYGLKKSGKKSKRALIEKDRDEPEENAYAVC